MKPEIKYNPAKLPFGYDEIFLTRPIKNLPQGTLKVRRTICAGGFPTAWLENKDGITRKYHLVYGETELELQPQFAAEKTDILATD